MAVDLHGVRRRRQDLSDLLAQPRWAAWWSRFLDEQRQAVAGELWPAAADSPAARHARAQHAAARLQTVALAAALTADESLARPAVDLLRQVSADPTPWMGPGHARHYPELRTDLLTAEQAKRIVAAACWLDPWLTDDARAVVASGLRERGGELLASDSARGAWWATAWNSNWCAVLNSGFGWVALYLAEPGWLAPAVHAVEQVLDLHGLEGSGIEGLSYWTYCARSCLDLAGALADTGDDRLVRHPFWSRAVDFPLHLALPDRSGWVNFGDCGYPGLGGSHVLYAAAALTGDGRAQWLADQLAGDRVGWPDLLWYDPAVPASPPDDEPPCRLFAAAQLASLRSDWSSEAVHFVLKGGSNAWSHCHLDLNSFVVTARGERLAVDPGPWPYTDSYWTSVEPPQSTAWHNTITVDGADQRQPPRYRLSFDLEESGDAWCRLDGFADGPDEAVVEGDATAAYADTLERFVRRVHYLKPDLFVICDRLRLREARAQRHLQWLLHAVRPLELRDDGAVIHGERADLWVRPLRPEDWAAKLLPDRLPPPGVNRPPVHAWALRPPWHHLWNVSPSRSPYPHWDPRGGEPLFGPDIEFVVVLEVTAAGAGPRWAPALDGGEVVLTAADGAVRRCAVGAP